MPQHKAMLEASRRVPSRVPAGEDPLKLQSLNFVAETFVQLHDDREKADYDIATLWRDSEAQGQVRLVEKAFETWRTIRTEPIAQSFIASLLVKGPKSS